MTAGEFRKRFVRTNTIPQATKGEIVCAQLKTN